MAQQSRLDVSKWQAARPQWVYTPALWFYYRMIQVAYIEARTKVNGKPTDAGLLARDWIARSTSVPGGERKYVSFPACCQMLDLDEEQERLALLDDIDKAVDGDTDEAWARLEELSAAVPKDDVEPLFNAPRIVTALDQITLF